MPWSTRWIHGHHLTVKSEHKFLGIIYDSKLRFFIVSPTSPAPRFIETYIYSTHQEFKTKVTKIDNCRKDPCLLFLWKWHVSAPVFIFLVHWDRSACKITCVLSRLLFSFIYLFKLPYRAQRALRKGHKQGYKEMQDIQGKMGNERYGTGLGLKSGNRDATQKFKEFGCKK